MGEPPPHHATPYPYEPQAGGGAPLMNNADFANRLFLGDCAAVLRGFPACSIDCIVTDPPYGIGFMGKNWDQALPPKEAFEQMFRVLKPGALAFVMSSPRQDVLWRMLQMLEGCGFQLRQSFVSWIYKSGFPKGYDLSLGIDKKFIRIEFVAEHGRKPTKDEMKALLNEKRKIIKKVKYNRASDASFAWQNGKHRSEPFKAGEHEYSISESYSEDAKKWSGWKSVTGLKPALECVLMVNKPMSEPTIVGNVLRHGVGAINVDACRIPFTNKESPEDLARSSQGFTAKSEIYHNAPKYEVSCESGNLKGRFPANLLVSDKALDTGKITKSGTIEPHHSLKPQKTNQIYGKYTNLPAKEQTTYGDAGDQSRYFDLDAWGRHHGFLDVPKASKKERDMGLNSLPTQRAKVTNFQAESVKYRMENGKITNPKAVTFRKNIHPTVKPIKLMGYLIELGCPPDGIVLDPFVGSGTTCIAAQKLNRKWCGIEINEDYMRIAAARIGVAWDDVVTQVKTPSKKAPSKIRCAKDDGCNMKSEDGFCFSKMFNDCEFRRK